MYQTRTRPAGAAAIYARVSTEAQATQDKTSLDVQVKNCRRTAKELGFTIAEGYVIREAHSASDPDNRPELQRLYQGAKAGQFQYVIMDVVDRTTRAGEWNLVDICTRFLNFDVEPLWASDPDWDLTTPEGQHEASDAAWEAYRDKARIARRFRNGKMGRIEDGQLIRAYLAYGYKWNTERPAYLTPDVRDPRTEWVPDEDGNPSPADVVRRIFWYLADGWRSGGSASAKQMAIMLANDHVPTPSQGKGHRRKVAKWGNPETIWGFQMVIYIVDNPTYKGQRPQNRWTLVPRTVEEKRAYEARTGRKYKNPFKHAERPQSEWMYAKVPALVDEQTWEDANKQLQSNRENAHRNPIRYTTDEVLLYGGLIRCSECEHSMHPIERKSTGSWMYRCPHGASKVPGRKHPGRTNTILCREVDEYAWHEAKRIIRDPAYLRSRLVQTQHEVMSPQETIEHYADLIKECDAKEATLYEDYGATRGKPGREGFIQRILDEVDRNSANRDEYAKKQQAARDEMRRRESKQERLAEFQAKARERAATLDDLDAEQRRQLLLDLHTTAYIARHDSDQPRIQLMFCLTSEAAAHAADGAIWNTTNIKTPQGQYVTFVEQGWPPVPRHLDGTEDDVIDLGEADDDTGDDNGNGGDDDPSPNGNGPNGQNIPSRITRHPEPSLASFPGGRGGSARSRRRRAARADRR